MMILYIHHGNNGMEMMIQELYSTYRVGGKFCYDKCQGMMVQKVVIMQCYGCGMFHICYGMDYSCYGMGMVVVCSTVAMIWLWYVPPGLVNQRSGCYGTLSGDPTIGGAVWQCPNKLV